MNINLKTVKPAKRYAEAFFETIKDKDAKKALDDIKSLNSFIQNDEKLSSFLLHPVISAEDKKELIKTAFNNFSFETINFIFVLIDENRLNCLSEIINFLQEKINFQNKLLLLEVTTAKDLNDEEKGYIKTRLENKFKQEILPDFKKDETIIGGMLIKLQDTVIDLSIKKKLENFKVM